MATLLICDDDTSFVASLSEGLAGYDIGFDIVVAANGRDAVEKMKLQAVDIVISDLHMPEMDGFELIAHISNGYSGTPIIVMTAYGTPEIRERLKRTPSLSYIEKPVDLDQLVRLIQEADFQRTTGDIRGVSLPGFLQLIEMEKKSCTLAVKSHYKEGRLFFRHGDLVDAEAGKLKGLRAALNVISWEEPQIKISSICERTERVIQLPIQVICLEAMRQKDELGSVAPEIAAEDRDQPEESFAPESEAVVQETLTTRRDYMDDIRMELQKLLQVDGVQSVAIVRTDGFAVDGLSKSGKIDLDGIAAVVSTGMGANAVMGRELNVGEILQLMAEYKNGVIVSSYLSEEGILAVVVDPKANLGSVRYQVQKRAPSIASLL